MAVDIQRRHSGGAQEVLGKVQRPATYRLKVLSCGSEQAGKSCLIKRYCEERFINKYLMTIGIDYGVKRVEIDGNDVRVNFWDLSGNGDFFEVRNEFYKDAQAMVLVYDVTVPRTFLQLDQWVAEASKFGAKDVVTVVCANKVDLPKRMVTEAEGKRWANSKGFAYMETSAQSGLNVSAMFEQLFRDAFRHAYAQ